MLWGNANTHENNFRIADLHFVPIQQQVSSLPGIAGPTIKKTN